MSSPQQNARQTERRVLKFRPRSSGALLDDTTTTVTPDEPDDFGQRMWTNAAAFAFTLALAGSGIWLAVSIGDLRRSQDCVLMGRRDCAGVAARSQPAPSTEPTIHRH